MAETLIKRLRDYCNIIDQLGHPPLASLLAEAATELEALRKRCEAVEADAARYRWLRANAVVGRMESRGTQPAFAMNCDEPESEWDACIDAHIAAAQEPSHG